MTYSQKYNPERYSMIQEIIEKVSSLRRGERLACRKRKAETCYQRAWRE